MHESLELTTTAYLWTQSDMPTRKVAYATNLFLCCVFSHMFHVQLMVDKVGQSHMQTGIPGLTGLAQVFQAEVHVNHNDGAVQKSEGPIQSEIHQYPTDL